MGQTQSRGAPGGEVVMQAPAHVPIQFSNSLVQHLDRAKEVRRSAEDRDVTNWQSMSTKAATVEEHIQERVEAELQRIRNREEQVRRDVEAELSRRNVETEKRADDPLNAVAMEQDIAALQKRFDQKMVKSTSAADSKMAMAAKEDLLACLKANGTKSLDCWSEVEEFKRRVTHLQQQYIQSHQ